MIIDKGTGNRTMGVVMLFHPIIREVNKGEMSADPSKRAP